MKLLHLHYWYLPRPLYPGLHSKNMFPRTPYSFPREEVVVAAAKRQKAPPSALMTCASSFLYGLLLSGGGGVARIQSLKHMVLRWRVQTRSSHYSWRPHSKRLGGEPTRPSTRRTVPDPPLREPAPLPGLHLLSKPC